MYERFAALVLRWLKLPPEPHPPFGAPASLRVFRAGRNYYRLLLAGWSVAQAFALAGIVFWAVILIGVEKSIRTEQPSETAPPPTSAAVQPGGPAGAVDAPADANQRLEKWKASFEHNVKAAATGAESGSPPAKKARRISGWAGFKQTLVEIGRLLPAWAFLLIWALKIFSFLAYLIQIPFTYAVLRFDYEMRWYMVTDRSLRLRHGVWKISESTMSFANIQQVVVTQGPLQRLLGLSDVKVTSAGGGTAHPGKPEKDMHTGHFHAVANAPEIRDLIVERLQKFRTGGLGDPDEHHDAPATATIAPQPSAVAPDALAAARELLEETRTLRRTCENNLT